MINKSEREFKEEDISRRIVPIRFDDFTAQTELKYLEYAAQLASSAFGWKYDEETIQETSSVLKGCDSLFLLDKDIPLGFISLKHLTLTSDVMHVSGMAVKKENQGEGIAGKLIDGGIMFLLEQGGNVDYVSGETQNPRVAKSRASYSKIVYPISADPTPEVIRLALEINTALGRTTAFDTNVLVHRNFYHESLYEERPLSKNEYINSFFREHVGDRDAVLLIGELPKKECL